MPAQYLEFYGSKTRLHANDVICYNKRTWKIRILRKNIPIAFSYGKKANGDYLAAFYLDDKKAFGSFCNFVAWSFGLNIESQTKEVEGEYRAKLLD